MSQMVILRQHTDEYHWTLLDTLDTTGHHWTPPGHHWTPPGHHRTPLSDIPDIPDTDAHAAVQNGPDSTGHLFGHHRTFRTSIPDTIGHHPGHQTGHCPDISGHDWTPGHPGHPGLSFDLAANHIDS